MSRVFYHGHTIEFMGDQARPTGWLLRARIHRRVPEGIECRDVYPQDPVVVQTREEAEARSFMIGMRAVDHPSH